MKGKSIFKKSLVIIGMALALTGYGVYTSTQSLESQAGQTAQMQSCFALSVQNYQYIQKEKMDIYRGDLLLVNEAHPYRFTDSAQELVRVYEYKNSDYKVKDAYLKLDRSVIEPFNKMLSDFQEKTGCGDVNVISGYRTYAYQQNLLNERQEEEGEAANNWVAKPGASEHHTGQAVDLGILNEAGKSFTFKGTGTYKWIRKNAWRYGFIVRYQEQKKEITGINYEPWHYRYVGLPHAAIIQQKGFCYEEYIDFLRSFPFEKVHLQYEDVTGQYEIYFTQSLSVPVPNIGEFSISGNNVDGFIVTVRL